MQSSILAGLINDKLLRVSLASSAKHDTLMGQFRAVRQEKRSQIASDVGLLNKKPDQVGKTEWPKSQGVDFHNYDI